MDIATAEPAAIPHKWSTLLLLSLAEFVGMAVWFSASAVVLALTSAWSLTESMRAWLTMSVQIGFLAGAFDCALLNQRRCLPRTNRSPSGHSACRSGDFLTR